jgi:hypothetical protein
MSVFMFLPNHFQFIETHIFQKVEEESFGKIEYILVDISENISVIRYAGVPPNFVS